MANYRGNKALLPSVFFTLLLLINQAVFEVKAGVYKFKSTQDEEEFAAIWQAFASWIANNEMDDSTGSGKIHNLSDLLVTISSVFSPETSYEEYDDPEQVKNSVLTALYNKMRADKAFRYAISVVVIGLPMYKLIVNSIKEGGYFHLAEQSKKLYAGLRIFFKLFSGIPTVGSFKWPAVFNKWKATIMMNLPQFITSSFSFFNLLLPRTGFDASLSEHGMKTNQAVEAGLQMVKGLRLVQSSAVDEAAVEFPLLPPEVTNVTLDDVMDLLIKPDELMPLIKSLEKSPEEKDSEVVTAGEYNPVDTFIEIEIPVDISPVGTHFEAESPVNYSSDDSSAESTTHTHTTN